MGTYPVEDQLKFFKDFGHGLSWVPNCDELSLTSLNVKKQLKRHSKQTNENPLGKNLGSGIKRE